MSWFQNETNRAWLYRVLLAVSALVVGYGLITDEQAVLWLAVAAAVLGNGLAVKHTST